MKKLINGQYVRVEQTDIEDAIKGQSSGVLTLKVAIETLDVNVDAHWTKKDGLPDLNALRELTGGRVTRADVNKIAPDLTRDSLRPAAA